MALIRATCSDCGDVELRSRELKVRICRDSDAATYLFRCPVCRMTEVRNAEQHVVDVLLAAGVECTEWTMPAELNETRSGAAITHDDVLDFHQVLSDDAWFNELVAKLEG